ncbi:MAG: NERD domain-containing protein [Bacteroidaceae bacterium]|nr:NERD domain-containing protein [Bacteroidaceae bacterium]
MQLITLLITILGVALFAYLAWYNSASQKGKRGEKRISFILSLLPSDYTVLNDLVFRTEKGTTQIDHIVVSKYGIFAIETKNYRGEIYGDDNRQEWTQMIITNVTYAKKWWKTYTYVTKNHFYNPVKQSIGHALRIKEILSAFPHVEIVPIVVFAGDAILSNVRSRYHVVYQSSLLKLIKGYNTVYLTDVDVREVIRILEENNIRELVDDWQHAMNLRLATNKVDATIYSGICPKCGGHLVKRKGKYGTFFGCSNYPKCKYIAH